MQVDLSCCCSSARRRFYSEEVKGPSSSAVLVESESQHAQSNVMSLFLFEHKVAFAVAFRPLKTLLRCTVSIMRKFLRNSYCEVGKF